MKITDKQLAISINNIINTNDGYYKSDKQKDFLLEHVLDNVLLVRTTIYNNTTETYFYIDDKGVVEVIKNHKVRGRLMNTKIWERGNTELNSHRTAMYEQRMKNQLMIDIVESKRDECQIIADVWIELICEYIEAELVRVNCSSDIDYVVELTRTSFKSGNELGNRFVDGLSDHSKIALLNMDVEPSEIEHFNNLVQFIKTNC